MRLILLRNDYDFAEYAFESWDFTESGSLEKIGTIVIDKAKKHYDFELCESFKELPIIPPSFYGLSEAEQKLLLKTKYKDCGWGSWTMRIHRWATKFIEEDIYPAKR